MNRVQEEKACLYDNPVSGRREKWIHAQRVSSMTQDEIQRMQGVIQPFDPGRAYGYVKSLPVELRKEANKRLAAAGPRHTPGPWKYESATQTIRTEKENYWIATVDSWDGAVKDWTHRNGRLLAAAPELYAAAQAAMEHFTDTLDESDPAVAEFLQPLLAAIEKADGKAKRKPNNGGMQ